MRFNAATHESMQKKRSDVYDSITSNAHAYTCVSTYLRVFVKCYGDDLWRFFDSLGWTSGFSRWTTKKAHAICQLVCMESIHRNGSQRMWRCLFQLVQKQSQHFLDAKRNTLPHKMGGLGMRKRQHPHRQYTSSLVPWGGATVVSRGFIVAFTRFHLHPHPHHRHKSVHHLFHPDY